MSVEVEYTQEHDPLPRARSKLYLAIVAMAESDDSPLPKRLARAYIDNLIGLGTRNFPEALRPAFESIHDRMTSVEAAGDEGRIIATALAMSELDAKRLIAHIVMLFRDVCATLGHRGD